MVHAKLITGGIKEERQKAVNQIVKKALGLNRPGFHPDLMMIKGNSSIGIDQIRELKTKLALKPYQSLVKIALICQAEKLTLAAQNSFLKTLEEPPAKSLIILETANPNLLLTTITSRCQIIKLGSLPQVQPKKVEIKSHQQLILQILKSGVGERLKLAAVNAQNKEQAIEFAQIQLLAWRQLILKRPTVLNIRNLRNAQKAQEMLQANTNPLLTLSNLFLAYKPCTRKKNEV